MSILTKKVTMTETAWKQLETILNCHRDARRELRVAFGDVSDALTALAEAEIIAVTDTYANPVVDQWRRDAVEFVTEGERSPIGRGSRLKICSVRVRVPPLAPF